MEPEAWLDIYDILRNEIFGDTIIFIIAIYVLSNYYLMKAKAPHEVTIVINVLVTGIIFEQTRIIVLWASIVLFVGFISYNTINKWISR